MSLNNKEEERSSERNISDGLAARLQDQEIQSKALLQHGRDLANTLRRLQRHDPDVKLAMKYIEDLPKVKSVPSDLEPVILIASSLLPEQREVVNGKVRESHYENAIFLCKAGFLIGTNPLDNCINEYHNGPFRVNSKRMAAFPQSAEEMEQAVMDVCQKISESGRNHVMVKGMHRPLHALWTYMVKIPLLEDW